VQPGSLNLLFGSPPINFRFWPNAVLDAVEFERKPTSALRSKAERSK
jgi:hypothetical protein